MYYWFSKKIKVFKKLNLNLVIAKGQRHLAKEATSVAKRTKVVHNRLALDKVSFG